CEPAHACADIALPRPSDGRRAVAACCRPALLLRRSARQPERAVAFGIVVGLPRFRGGPPERRLVARRSSAIQLRQRGSRAIESRRSLYARPGARAERDVAL